MPARLENEMRINAKIQELLKDLPQYVTEWHMNLQASNKTAASRRDMVAKIGKFLRYIDNDAKNVPVSAINETNVTSYYISVGTKQTNYGVVVQTSDSHKQAVYCALKNFFGFLVRRGYISKNYIEDIEKPKNHDLERINEHRVRFDKSIFERVLKEVEKEKDEELRARDIAILKLFMSTGMRETALMILNVEDVDFKRSTVSTIDKGKGGKLQVYPLECGPMSALREWANVRENIPGASATDALFLNKYGERLSENGISKMVQKYFGKVMNRRITPHKIRGGVASILYAETGDVEFVRRSIGHKKGETTQRYIVTDNKEREKAAAILNF